MASSYTWHLAFLLCDNSLRRLLSGYERVLENFSRIASYDPTFLSARAAVVKSHLVSSDQCVYLSLSTITANIATHS